MRWFSRRGNKKNTLHLSEVKATATRAIIDIHGHHKMPNIHLFFEFRTPREDGVTGDIIDNVEVEMDIWEAGKFASQLLASLDAATPRVPKGNQRIPWAGGE
jgi:hypothetical protein